MKKYIFFLLLIPLLLSGVSFSYADNSPSFIIIYTPDEVTLEKNMDILREYSIVVYGFPWDIENYGVELNSGPQKQDENGEWRYLGLNENLEPVTNSRFVNEMGFVGDRSKRNFVYEPWREGLEKNYGYKVNKYQWDIIREQLAEKYPGIPCGPFDDDRYYYVIQATPGEDGDTSGSLREWHWWLEGGAKQYGYETYTGIFVPPPVPIEEPEEPIDPEQPIEEPTTLPEAEKPKKIKIMIDPNYYEVTVGGQKQYKAFINGLNGEDVTSQAEWYIQGKAEGSDLDVGKMIGKGLAQGMAIGTAHIKAVYNGEEDSATFEVVKKEDHVTYPPKYFRVRIVPNEGTFTERGQSRQYRVIVEPVDPNDYYGF